MTGTQDLTPLPEWSRFFREAMWGALLHFRWHREDREWSCEAYDFSRDLTRPIETVTLSHTRHADRFEALRLSIVQCGRGVSQVVWDAFYAFRAAAGGHTDIEDLI